MICIRFSINIWTSLRHQTTKSKALQKKWANCAHKGVQKNPTFFIISKEHLTTKEKRSIFSFATLQQQSKMKHIAMCLSQKLPFLLTYKMYFLLIQKYVKRNQKPFVYDRKKFFIVNSVFVDQIWLYLLKSMAKSEYQLLHSFCQMSTWKCKTLFSSLVFFFISAFLFCWQQANQVD